MRNLYRKNRPSRMTVAILKQMCGLIMLIGIFIVAGAIGGCDAGLMSIGKALFYIACGLIAAAGGVLMAVHLDGFKD